MLPRKFYYESVVLVLLLGGILLCYLRGGGKGCFSLFLLSDGPCPSVEYTSGSPAANVHALGSLSEEPWIASTRPVNPVSSPRFLHSMVSSGIARSSSWGLVLAPASAGTPPRELIYQHTR